MSDTVTPTPAPDGTPAAIDWKTVKVSTNPETKVEHKRVEDVVGENPRSKKNEPTVARSARFFFERAEANKDLLVPVFETQNIRAVKGAKPTVVPVYSDIFKIDLDLTTAVKVFESEANVVRMAIDFANNAILAADAVAVRTAELSENPEALEAKRYADAVKAREESKGKDSITPEWITSAKKRIALLVAQELEYRKLKREFDEEEKEDNRGYDTTAKTDDDDDDENNETETAPAPQSAPAGKLVKDKKPGRK